MSKLASIEAKIVMVNSTPPILSDAGSCLHCLDASIIQLDRHSLTEDHLDPQVTAAIVIDLNLSSGGGLALARQIRGQATSTSPIPILFIADRSVSEAQLEEAHSLNNVDFIFRPYPTVVLHSKLQFFVDLFQKTKVLNSFTTSMDQNIAGENERLRLIAAAIPDLIAYVGNDECYRFVNASYEYWLGQKPENIVGRKMRDVLGNLYSFSAPRIQQALQGVEVRFEAKLPKDEKVHHLDVHYIPDFDDNRQVRGFIIIAHDISEIQDSREIIQNQSHYLKLVLNRVQAGVMLIDPNTGSLKLNNDAAENMTRGLKKNVNDYGQHHRLLDAAGNLVDLPSYPQVRAARGERMQGEEFTWISPFGSGDFLIFSDMIPASFGQPSTALLSFLDISSLKKTERELRQKEVEMRTLSNTIPQLAWMANPDGSIFWFNDRWYDYTGTTPEEMEGWGWQSVYEPSSLQQVRGAYQKTLKTGEHGDFEFPIRSKTGEYRWFLTRWIPLKDSLGNVFRWFGTSTDIHDQRLIREDQRFRANLTEQLNAEIGLHELTAIATRALAQQLDANRSFVAEVSGDLAVVHADYAQSLPSLKGEYNIQLFGPAMVDSWRGGKSQSVTNVALDSRTRNHCSAHHALAIQSFITIPLLRLGKLVAAMNVSDSKPRHWTERELGLVQAVADVVWAAFERVKLLEALRLTNSRSNFLAKASEVLSSSLDMNKVLKTLSDLVVPEFADWCSVRVLQSDGSLTQLAVSHKDYEKVQWAWEMEEKFPLDPNSPIGPLQVLRSGRSELASDLSPEILASAAVNEEHKEILLGIGFRSYICVPIKVRERILGTLSIVSTQESQRNYNEDDLMVMEELAHRAGLALDNARLYVESQNVNRLKDEFLATLSHELRTPMNVIQGYAEILKNESLPDELKNSVDAIFRNARAQTEIITDLLDVSSIITGKVAYKPVEVAPAKIVTEIVDGLKPAADAKKVHLDVDTRLAPQRTFADPLRLHQILWNLVSNAIKFSEADGSVSILISSTGNFWSIEVKDSGKGIDPVFLPFVFDRFRQEDASTTRKFGGLGLGLSISKNLVELHGGTIRVESRGRGHGAKFIVRFPMAAIHSEIHGEMETMKIARTPDLLAVLDDIKILLVEDSLDNRELVSLILNKVGAKVVLAESPAEAREKLKHFIPDVIVSDIGMPQENGMEFIAKLRKSEISQLATIPAIALTAYVRQEEQEAAIKAGFQSHVSKPISPPLLFKEIYRLVRQVKSVKKFDTLIFK